MVVVIVTHQAEKDQEISSDVNQRDILNMPNKELEMWISSDEIDVSAEEDVFKIILA